MDYKYASIRACAQFWASLAFKQATKPVGCKCGQTSAYVIFTRVLKSSSIQIADSTAQRCYAGFVCKEGAKATCTNAIALRSVRGGLVSVDSGSTMHLFGCQSRGNTPNDVSLYSTELWGDYHTGDLYDQTLLLQKLMLRSCSVALL